MHHVEQHKRTTGVGRLSFRKTFAISAAFRAHRRRYRRTSRRVNVTDLVSTSKTRVHAQQD